MSSNINIYLIKRLEAERAILLSPFGVINPDRLNAIAEFLNNYQGAFYGTVNLQKLYIPHSYNYREQRRPNLREESIQFYNYLVEAAQQQFNLN